MTAERPGRGAWVVAAAIGVVVAAGLYGSTLGFAEDADSLAIHDRLADLRQLHYRPSRTWGVPLYELVAAVLDGIGGVWLCNVGSLGFTLVALAALAATVRPDRERSGQLAFLAVALHPLVLTNASTLMETALHLAFAALAVWRALAVVDRRAPPTDAGLWASALGLLLTRPDGVITLAAIAAMLVVAGRDTRERALPVALAAAVGLAAVGGYGLLNGGFGFLARDVLLADTWVRRVIRSAVGAANVFGVLAPLALFALLADAARWARRATWDPALVLLGVGVGGWALRYTLLPDELEYLLPAWLLLVVVAARLRFDRALVVLAASAALSGTVTVSLFERRAGDALSIAPALQEGGLLQDWRIRRFESLMHSDAFRRRLGVELLGRADPLPERPNHFGAFVGPGRELIVGRDMLYLWDNPRNPQETFRRASYSRVLVCEVPLALGRGWRLMQPLRSDEVVRRFRSDAPLPCAEDRLSGPDTSP